MKRNLEKKHFVGIDISKETIDLALLKHEETGVFHDLQLPNTIQGFKSIAPWLRKLKVKTEECMFCMEHTGTYGLLLFTWLTTHGIDFCVEPGFQIKKSLGMVRGKNDIIDARRIADYAQCHQKKLKLYQVPSTLIIKIKQLLTYRDQMVRIKTMLQNSIKAHNQIEALTGDHSITCQLEEMILEKQRVIQEAETQITSLIQSDTELSKSFRLAISVKGIGTIIAAMMIVTTNNFISFENGRKYACYAGIAPFEHTSGSSCRGRARVSFLANKKIKTLLSNGAQSAIRWDPELRAYYQRKIREGKEHKLIINAVSCKLVNRIFAVVKRQQPYVITYQQNFLQKT
jgi:transposase